MWHTRAALARPVTTWMAFAALAVIGLISARQLPLEEMPDITFPGVFINVPYPGSTPEEVERLITRPIEEALATMRGAPILKDPVGDRTHRPGDPHGFAVTPICLATDR